MAIHIYTAAGGGNRTSVRSVIKRLLCWVGNTISPWAAAKVTRAVAGCNQLRDLGSHFSCAALHCCCCCILSRIKTQDMDGELNFASCFSLSSAGRLAQSTLNLFHKKLVHLFIKKLLDLLVLYLDRQGAEELRIRWPIGACKNQTLAIFWCVCMSEWKSGAFAILFWRCYSCSHYQIRIVSSCVRFMSYRTAQ